MYVALDFRCAAVSDLIISEILMAHLKSFKCSGYTIIFNTCRQRLKIVFNLIVGNNGHMNNRFKNKIFSLTKAVIKSAEKCQHTMFALQKETDYDFMSLDNNNSFVFKLRREDAGG